MAKKIVINVTVNCEKDKKGIMKSVAKLEGIDEMKLDAGKGTLTIIGDVDPVCAIKALRKKCGRCAEFESIGPPKPPESPKPKSPKCPPKCHPPCPPKCPPPCHLPPGHPPICGPPPRHCDYDSKPCPISPCPPRHCDCDSKPCPIL